MCPNYSLCNKKYGHEGTCSHEEPINRDDTRPASSRTRQGRVTKPWRSTVNGCNVCDGNKCRDREFVPICTTRKCLYSRGHDGEHSFEEWSEAPPDNNDYDKVHVLLGDSSFSVCSTDIEVGKFETPSKYDEAVNGPQGKEWKAATDLEIQTLTELGTWEKVSRSKIPKGRKALKSKWVFKIKYARDGSIERFKARFVVCGYSQVQGRDYTHAFSATLRSTSFRTLLAIASGNGLKLEHFDVTNAFTQADIGDSDIWVEPAPGFDNEGDKHGTFVYKLRKALYGTKQASREWQNTLAKFLVDELGFERSTTDPCIFKHKSKEHGWLIVGIYVDDIILAHDHKGFEWFKTSFTKRFTSKHLGNLDWFLGIAVDQHDDYTVSINQKQYILNLVEKYLKGHSSKKQLHPQSDKFAKLRGATTDEERAAARDLPYQNLVGALLYLTVMTRSECAYHTSILAKFMSNPTVECYEMAITLLKYFANEPDLSIHYSGSRDPPAVTDQIGRNPLRSHASSIHGNGGFVAYSDASWGPGVDYPMFGYVIYLFGGIVSYRSRQLKIVCFSSCEAEYAAAANTCQEVSFIRKICADMGFLLKDRLVLLVDNTAAIEVAQNVGVSAKTKHFETCIHYFRHEVQHGRIVPIHILTSFQRADGFTKGLDRKKFLEWSIALYDRTIHAIYKGVSNSRS